MLTGETYINVHSTAHPDGEIRGQVAPGISPPLDGAGYLTAELNGANQPGDVETTAEGWFVLNLETGDWTLVVADLEGVTAAHIHLGGPGVQGPVIFPLFGVSPSTPAVDNGVLASGTVDFDTLAGGELLYRLLTDDTYVNVHTEAHEGGEIRGQLQEYAGQVWLASLTGAQVPADPPVVTEAGGFALFFEMVPGLSIEYVLIVDDIEGETAAHIHAGAPGEEGDVVVTLFTAGEQSPPVGSGVLATGLITVPSLQGPLAGDTDLNGLIALMNANGAYVNVHTADYPDGEIRGVIAPI
jgi:hypothetical protein